MTASIPKIIHQIWSDINEPLPEHYMQFAETWKKCHPLWKYEFWDHDRMNAFIERHYRAFKDTYLSFQYNIQRWDAIRYLILDKIGGMYVDFDIECLRPLDNLIQGKTCCFSLEPESHCLHFGMQNLLNNGLMACIPKHPFMKKIIEVVFSYVPKKNKFSEIERRMEILTTTGPLVVSDTYYKYQEKEQIYLIPAAYVSPLDMNELALVKRGYENKEFDKKIQNAYAVHYFGSNWWL